MELNKHHIGFNPEERFITGLPDHLPLRAAGVAFSMTRRARMRCFERFENLLTCDPAVLSDEMAGEMHSYPGRLDRLDELSQKLVPLVMPKMIAEFEQLFAQPYSLDNERLNVTRR